MHNLERKICKKVEGRLEDKKRRIRIEGGEGRDQVDKKREQIRSKHVIYLYEKVIK